MNNRFAKNTVFVGVCRVRAPARDSDDDCPHQESPHVKLGHCDEEVLLTGTVTSVHSYSREGGLFVCLCWVVVQKSKVEGDSGRRRNDNNNRCDVQIYKKILSNDSLQLKPIWMT